MHKLLAPVKAHFLFIIPALFTLFICISAALPDLHAAPKPDTEAEIEQALRQQLPPVFVLESWTHSLVKQAQKGPITIDQSSLAISVRLKEPLYVDTGRRAGGKTVIRVSREKGEIIELEGVSVVAQAPVMGISKVQVTLNPMPPGKAGVQLSRFAPGTFIISDVAPGTVVDSHEGGSQHAAEANPAQQQAPTGASPAPGVIQKLWSEFGSGGEIWGRETYGAYQGTPVVLRNLKMVNAQTLEGILDRPSQGLSNAFTLMGTDSSLSLRIQAANPASKGTPATLYRVALEDEQLVARLGPVIPLSQAESDTLRERFVQEKMPWKFKGDISDYAQLGNRLIDVNSLELVTDRWGNRPLAAVKNLPGRFWAMDSNYELSVMPFGAYRASMVHTDDPKQASLIPLAGVEAETWVSSDLSRYVSLKQGDVWVGTLDWQTGTAGAAKNLTGIGVLNNLEPIAWCEQYVFFFNPQGSDKPILRVDTQSGELKEMAKTKALNKAQGSPDGCFLFASDGRMVHSAQGAKSDLYVVDLRTLDEFTLDASFDGRIYVGTQKQPPSAQAVMAQFWIGPGLFWVSRQHSWIDLANRKRINPHEFARVVEELPYNIRPFDMLQIPGDRYVEVSYQGFTTSKIGQSKPVRKRYRLDRLQGTVVSLPLHSEPEVPSSHVGIVWVDENRYVYPRRKGHLDELGTWLYDIHSKKHTRLSRFYADQNIYAQNRAFSAAAQAAWSTPLYFEAAYLVLPDKNRILFSTTRGDLQELVSVSLDGKELARKSVPGGAVSAGTHNRLRRLHPYEISLPFVERAAFHVAGQSARQYAAVVETKKGKPAKASASPAVAKEAEGVKAWCYKDPKIRSDHDCECVADRFIEERLADPGVGKDVLLPRIMGVNRCPNPEGIRQRNYEECIVGRSNRPGSVPDGIALEAYCQCVSKRFAKAVSGHKGQLGPRRRGSYNTNALMYCRRSDAY